MPKIVDPPENAREDIRILHDISERMVQKGFIRKNLIPWKSYDELLGAGFPESELSYQELCERGPIINEPRYRKYVEHGFRTPTGKFELYSERMERYSYEPLPTYRECEESQALMPRLAEKYPLYLTTRRSLEYALSRSADYEWARTLTPYPRLHIHPDTAGERGIEAGYSGGGCRNRKPRKTAIWRRTSIWSCLTTRPMIPRSVSTGYGESCARFTNGDKPGINKRKDLFQHGSLIFQSILKLIDFHASGDTITSGGESRRCSGSVADSHARSHDPGAGHRFVGC